MKIIQTFSYFKLIIIYIFYNSFLKVLFYFLNPLIYEDRHDNVNENFIFLGKGDSIATKIASTIFVNIFNDWFWLLPFTIMNLYVFIKLILHLIEEKKWPYQHISFTLLKVYAIWGVIYLLIHYIFFKKNNFGDNCKIELLSIYGNFPLCYFLLGNFCFLLIFVPLWNNFIKKWVIKDGA